MHTLGLLLALALLSLALLLAVPPHRELSYGFQRNTTATAASISITPEDGLPYTRRNIHFDSHGTTCDAWLYTPLPPEKLAGADGSGGPAAQFPVVIMAHGLGAQKELGLHRFADGFAGAGLAVMVFDYRTFGGSDGEPRHWVSPTRHLDDWRAALRFVKSGGLGPEYDTHKVGLWGTSYAGGHVLVVASEQAPGSLAAVISMIPHLDGVEASKASVRQRGLAASLRLLGAGIHDRLRAAASDFLQRTAAWLQAQSASQGAMPDQAPAYDRNVSVVGRTGFQRLVPEVERWLRQALLALLPPVGSWPVLEPAYIKVVGLEGELALMQLSPNQLEAYFAKHPKEYEGGWRPVILSRFTLEASSYSPIKSVPRVTAPVLFISALRDQLCPAEKVRKAAELLQTSNSNSSGGSSITGELLELDCTHFDAYLGEHLVAATESMVRFLRRHMQPPADVSVPMSDGMSA
ncbi:hypothetical protein VaNZ11_000215 [Volvox africanus]|uniref:Serine aminopeptidase S33 domain-containing protein n=1 Tax=Volvox africanus TaxID=51714 RepID=A0ABQ5RLU6_9CHLO|nr:hypothetical protein VaNZ11_000215 [Volvox africanus]